MLASELTKILIDEQLQFVTGVPCSYLKHFLSYLNTNQVLPIKHILATHEGEAMGIAAGYHLATKNIPIVYLQNSGLGNIVNPLTSLFAQEIYSIPAILFLTWRGEPNLKDEPQHKVMGTILLDLLKLLDIDYEFADTDSSITQNRLQVLKDKALQKNKPVALIFKTGLIKGEGTAKETTSNLATREEVLEILLEKIGENPIVTTTGKTSREVFELREKHKQSHKYDFLTVGSMGHAASIGLGLSSSTKKHVYVIDGDGSVLMKMGSLATIGHYKPTNFTHIIVDNGVYESTGSQPTVSSSLSWLKLFEACGYEETIQINSTIELQKINFEHLKNPAAIIIHVQPSSR